MSSAPRTADGETVREARAGYDRAMPRHVNIAKPAFTYEPDDPPAFARACSASGRCSAPPSSALPSTSCRPARLCPYHYEYAEEEWLLVLEGRPT